MKPKIRMFQSKIPRLGSSSRSRKSSLNSHKENWLSSRRSPNAKDRNNNNYGLMKTEIQLLKSSEQQGKIKQSHRNSSVKSQIPGLKRTKKNIRPNSSLACQTRQASSRPQSRNLAQKDEDAKHNYESMDIYYQTECQTSRGIKKSKNLEGKFTTIYSLGSFISQDKEPLWGKENIIQGNCKDLFNKESAYDDKIERK